MLGRNTNRRITRAYGVAWVATISRLLKIIDSFAKKPYKRDDILQKRYIILRSLLLVATPYLAHTRLPSRQNKRVGRGEIERGKRSRTTTRK